MLEFNLKKNIIAEIEQSEIYLSINTKTNGKNFLIDNESFEKAFHEIVKGYNNWADVPKVLVDEEALDEMLDEAFGRVDKNAFDYITQYEAYFRVLGGIQHLVKGYFAHAEIGYFFLKNQKSINSLFEKSNKLMFDYKHRSEVETMILKNNKEQVLAIDEFLYGNGVKFKQYMESLEYLNTPNELDEFTIKSQNRLDRLLAFASIVSKMHLV